MLARTRLLHLPARAARAVWWAGLPVVVLGWMVLADDVLLPFLPLTEAAAAIWPVSPVAAELLAHYPFTIAATVLAITLAAWSHRRFSAAMSPQSLLLPTYLAGLEAGSWQYWALSCGGLGGATLRETHALLHTAAAASLIATGAPMLIAVVVMRAARHGVRGTMPRLHWLSACAATASAMLIWLMYDLLFFWSRHPI
ncbi:MAG TPA: hypothetical protein VEK11_13880 [Thermoanaerobaculia bacterium]|nr:hypothetical protein [Thermoanaerobaculia bacterium]